MFILYVVNVGIDYGACGVCLLADL